jgi:DNA repair exonuclease SbcCD ATPase subunit
MDGNNIEKLEELIPLAIKEIRWLRSQNDALREDLNRRMTELDNQSSKGDQVKKLKSKITELEKENKRLETGQTKVRKKVGNILSELEKADFM